MCKMSVNIYDYLKVPKDTVYNFKKDCIGNFYCGFYNGFYVPFIAIIGRKYFNCTPFQLSLLISVTFLSGFISMLVASWVPVNKENRYMAGMGIVGAMFIICISPWVKSSVIYTAMAMSYSLCASFAPLFNVIVQRIYRDEIRARLLGYSNSLKALLSLVCSVIANIIIEKQFYGIDVWRILYIIAGLSVICNMYFCFWKLKMPKVESDRINSIEFLKDSFCLLKNDKLNTCLIISGVFYTCAYTLTNTLAPIFQNDILKIGPGKIAVLIFIQNLFCFIGYPLIGHYMQKYGAVKAWIITIFMGIIMAFGYGTCPVHFWQYLYFYYIFFGLFMAANDICWINLLLYIANGKKVTEYQTLHNFFMAVRGIIGIGVSAFIINEADKYLINYKYVFYISVLFLIISYVIVKIIFKDK